MRESYRLNRHLLAGEDQSAPRRSFEIVFMFTGRAGDIRRGGVFAEVNNSMRRIMKVIAQEEA